MTPGLPTLAELRDLQAQFLRTEPAAVLTWAYHRLGERAAIGTSLQSSGLVLLHQAREAGLPLPVFTIDTGLLFPEIERFRGEVERFFGISIEVLRPTLSLEAQADGFGAALWRRRPDACCDLRKVEPLRHHLAGLHAWITGVRRDQSAARQSAEVFELYRFDPVRDRSVLKINPLAGWSGQEVETYLERHKIPRNPLVSRGYRSIGCVPCTRSVGEGEGERAGRWTGFEKTECGLHTFLGAHV